MVAEGRADLMEKVEYGWNALLCAARYGHLHIVKWVLGEGGADINERDTTGQTAIQLATYGHLHVTEWPLETGGATIRDTNVLQYGVWHHLHTAIQQKRIQHTQLAPLLRCMLILDAPSGRSAVNLHTDMKHLLREGRLLRERLPHFFCGSDYCFMA